MKKYQVVSTDQMFFKQAFSTQSKGLSLEKKEVQP